MGVDAFGSARVLHRRYAFVHASSRGHASRQLAQDTASLVTRTIQRTPITQADPDLPRVQTRMVSKPAFGAAAPSDHRDGARRGFGAIEALPCLWRVRNRVPTRGHQQHPREPVRAPVGSEVKPGLRKRPSFDAPALHFRLPCISTSALLSTGPACRTVVQPCTSVPRRAHPIAQDTTALERIPDSDAQNRVARFASNARRATVTSL